MTQAERRLWLIDYLKKENTRYADLEVPRSSEEQFRLYRSLVNVRMPQEASEAYYAIEDAYLQEELRDRVTHLADLTPVEDGLYLWQGDITTIDTDAIVNAANSQLLGCFVPCHACIDNCIHTFAGVRLRKKCDELMTAQGTAEPTGQAKITPSYNLPSKYVIHTVGPIVSGTVTDEDRQLLRSSYLECLTLADAYQLDSIAFCCISTGVFRFPNGEAAQLAVQAVRDYKKVHGSHIKVVFNVFLDKDREIYQSLLG